MKVPYKDEGLQLMKAMLEAKLSEHEVAYRFGKSRSKVRQMIKGQIKADEYLVRAIRKLKRG